MGTGWLESSPGAAPRARSVALVFALVATGLALGCSIGAPEVEESPDASPIEVKEPEDHDGSETASGCEGITELGLCDDGVAVKCDVEEEELRRTDCAALGERCVVDWTATGPEAFVGAVCRPPDEDVPSCDDGLDFEGYCDGDTARWCDDDAEQVWDCGAEAGIGCAEDECEPGAFCCEGEGESGGDADCDDPDFESACVGEHGQTARSCEDGEVVEEDCLEASDFDSCQVDACEDGAACCPGESECAELGVEGECAGSTVRYCPEEDDYYENDCSWEGYVCGDHCRDEGYGCCEPDCDDVPEEGTCIRHWLIFCVGGSVDYVNCPEDEDKPYCDPDPDDSDFAECSDTPP